MRFPTIPPNFNPPVRSADEARVVAGAVDQLVAWQRMSRVLIESISNLATVRAELEDVLGRPVPELRSMTQSMGDALVLIPKLATEVLRERSAAA